ncbi:class II aldolase/adducin family protein [Gottschalkiaceae bacterium SANA]|nr:class II aldolase/adducin family protein [Gottschalkiaceae bacterium SANA]
MSVKKLKTELLDVTLESYELKLMAGTSGNASVYDKESQAMIITPSSVSYDGMTIEDLVVMKLDGTIIEGKHDPSSEWKMHAQMYLDREDISCVLHTHSPYATGFAVCQEGIPVILIEMVPFLGGDVPVAAFGMPGTAELGLEALKVMNDRKGCLLANHGTLAIGSSIRSTFMSSIYLEDAAKIYHIAKNAGNVKVIPQEYVEAMRNS